MALMIKSLFIIGIVCILAKRSSAIKGGTSADICQYPGMAKVTAGVNLLCNGVVVATDKLLMPQECALIISGVNMAMPVSVNANYKSWTLNTGTARVTASTTYPGVSEMRLPTRGIPNAGSCSSEGTLYTGTEDIDSSTCVVLGFSATSSIPPAGIPHFSTLKKAPITKSTGASCCEAIADTIPASEGYNSKYVSNCLTSSGAACSMGDAGAPVMCKTKGGNMQIIALTPIPKCNAGSLFLAYDVTGSSEKVRFGNFKR